MMTSRVLVALVFGLSLVSATSFAQSNVPTCLDAHHNVLDVDNGNVLLWKVNTPNQHLERAHIKGTVTKVYANATGHNHFQATIADGKNSGTIEVIYNIDSGAIKNLKIGQSVEACGDYITSNKNAGGYKASPDGAIIHWVHGSDNVAKHENGYTIVNGVLYGYSSNGNSGNNNNDFSDNNNGNNNNQNNNDNGNHKKHGKHGKN